MSSKENIEQFVECLSNGLAPILEAMEDAVDQANLVFAQDGIITEIEVSGYTFQIDHVHIEELDTDVLNLIYKMSPADFKELREQCAIKAQLSLEEIDQFYQTNIRHGAFNEPVRSAEEEVFEWIHFDSGIVIDQEHGGLEISDILDF